MPELDCSAWFIGKDFTTDWATHNFATWNALLADRRDEALKILEIGSWEGRSAIFFLNYFPNSALTIIDTFAGGPECLINEDWSQYLKGLEQRFDRNVAEFGSRLAKIKATSYAGLARLAIELQRFDLVYIDGSHYSADVYADAAMSWPLLVPQGILIFDDYEWVMMDTEAARPKLGVDAFLAAQAGQYRELHRGYQIIVEKYDPQQGTLAPPRNSLPD